MIIGLSGPAGCGKDTVAEILVSRYAFRNTSFAETLYREVADAFGITVEVLAVRATKELPMAGLEPVFCLDLDFTEVIQRVDKHFDWHKAYSPRQIMQWWGTEYRRAQDSDYWIRQVHDRIIAGQRHDRLLRQEKSWVIMDVRFQNEADIVHDLSGILVVVERKTRPVSKHQSESFWAACTPDFRLDNSLDMDHLHKNLADMMDAFTKGDHR